MHGSVKRRAQRAVVVGVVVGAQALGGMASAADKPAAPKNLIRDSGAERAIPDGGDTVAVPGWTVAVNGYFTAVAYGTPGGYPSGSSPGPRYRGHNFFAGGPAGNGSTGTQVDSLAAQSKLIRSGRARFTLSGWLGGFSSQRDHVTLKVTWETAAGGSLGTARIGPVTPAQRDDVTGMLFRTTSGAVPSGAARALVTLHMVRLDGVYDDGYADNLSLTIHR